MRFTFFFFTFLKFFFTFNLLCCLCCLFITFLLFIYFYPSCTALCDCCDGSARVSYTDSVILTEGHSWPEPAATNCTLRDRAEHPHTAPQPDTLQSKKEMSNLKLLNLFHGETQEHKDVRGCRARWGSSGRLIKSCKGCCKDSASLPVCYRFF